MTVRINGVGLALRGVHKPADLLTGTPVGDEPPVDPAERLGSRGLRYKDRATQLALCAVRDALPNAVESGAEGQVDGPTAVVVASVTGNLGTVCAVTSTIAQEGTRGVSPMDLPNASSNVVASSVAIKFGLRGPNLTVCNGNTSGVDALFWAHSLLESGRARRVVVVGVEPADEMSQRLLGGAVLDGAVALVLSREGAGARIAGFARKREPGACLDELRTPQLWLTSGPEPARAGVVVRDVSTVFGHAAGALGVLQCAVADEWLRANDAATAVITAGDPGDAVGGCLIERGSS